MKVICLLALILLGSCSNSSTPTDLAAGNAAAVDVCLNCALYANETCSNNASALGKCFCAVPGAADMAVPIGTYNNCNDACQAQLPYGHCSTQSRPCFIACGPVTGTNYTDCRCNCDVDCNMPGVPGFTANTGWTCNQSTRTCNRP